MQTCPYKKSQNKCHLNGKIECPSDINDLNQQGQIINECAKIVTSVKESTFWKNKSNTGIDRR